MKFIEGDIPTVELTRRNIETLLLKLDDPLSACTLLCPDGKVYVRAVERWAESYVGEAPVPMVTLKRSSLEKLLNGDTLTIADRVYVKPVADEEHYADRAPGPMYMPTSGKTL